MRRLRLMRVVAIPAFVAVLGSLPTSAGASAATVSTPGPPTGVHASSIAGIRGATVSWGAPVSDGGSPILFYVASNYTGSNFCVSFDPGPGTCHIDGFQVGIVRPSIRVRAVNVKGRGAVVVTLPVVTRQIQDSGNTSPPMSSGASLASVSQITPTSASGPTGVSGTSTAFSTSAPTQLPFSGADVEALTVAGVSLVLCGLLILGPFGQRRRGDEFAASSFQQ